MGLLDDIRDFLIRKGVVEGSTGWKCYIGYLPDDVDQAVALYLTGGMTADTLARENELPTFQVRVRTGRFQYTECEAQWRKLFDALDRAGPGQVSPDPLTGYALVDAMATAPLVWYDEKLRVNMTQNYRVVKARP